MIYIADKNSAFASYSTEELAEKAVRLLPDNGYNGQNIRVLLPTNQSTRTFAQGMQIEVPAGVADDPTADLALDGASGFLNLFHDSHSKSFTDCIARLGVPADWCDSSFSERSAESCERSAAVMIRVVLANWRSTLIIAKSIPLAILTAVDHVSSFPKTSAD